MKISVGFTVSIAVVSARSSAIHLGTSSPSVMWKAVMTVKGIAIAIVCAVVSAT